MRNRVFIFDDEEIIRDLLMDICEDLTCEAHAYVSPSKSPMFVNGEFRWDNRDDCCDVVIADINMPDINGIDFIWGNQIAGHSIDHIALISGYWTAATEAKVRGQGYQVFHKPFKMAEIRTWLESCISAGIKSNKGS